MDALEAIAWNSEVLKRSKDAGERAVALCWILHLVGDVHQPLHRRGVVYGGFVWGRRKIRRGIAGGNSVKFGKGRTRICIFFVG